MLMTKAAMSFNMMDLLVGGIGIGVPLLWAQWASNERIDLAPKMLTYWRCLPETRTRKGLSWTLQAMDAINQESWLWGMGSREYSTPFAVQTMLVCFFDDKSLVLSSRATNAFLVKLLF